MSYFSDLHDFIRYPLKSSEDYSGLRKSQIGAAHAISAHFTLQDRAALVVLPTGAGKTAVLMLASYILRAKRALIITPSRFVREQISNDYKTLKTLKLAGALSQEVEAPSLFENKNRMKDWEVCRGYDVVVSTPNSASPAYREIPAPPQDLFDLLLIDEAHHIAATTWSAIIENFPSARSVLFTATPFRNDKKEVKGKYVFTYPIQRAFDDGIYGEMTYHAVETAAGVENDVLIARATEQTFNMDAEKGFQHAVMVRADTRHRADQLAEVYKQHTGLRLEVVHSKQSLRTVEKSINKLRDGELDGVICVDMLGEGFDLPRLKIAALHAPHRSLAVTLQFFGRFARVNANNLGQATFLAIPDEIKGCLDEIFDDSPAWGRKIRNIGQDRITQEVEMQEFLNEFSELGDSSVDAAYEDLSLYSFNLFNHVKIFQAYGKVDLKLRPELSGFETMRVWENAARATLVILVRERSRPKWATTNGLDRIEHHLFVAHFDEPANLLFICATYREDFTYRELASQLVSGRLQALSLSKINRVLRNINGLELFNVGMRNRATGTVAESYLQKSGSAAHKSIDPSDAALYHRGHIFGRGSSVYGQTTIGLSSLSKVWRLDYTKLPQLIHWCSHLAREIENDTPVTTGIELDFLDAGRDITELPDARVIAVDWHEGLYKSPPIVRGEGSLLDFDLRVDYANSDEEKVMLRLVGAGKETALKFSLSPYPNLSYANDTDPRLQVDRGIKHIDLVDYLQDNSLRFHLEDGSLIEGSQIFDASEVGTGFDLNLIEGYNWQDEGVDIEKEYGPCTNGLLSIHDWLGQKLLSSNVDVLFYDHGTGECADFLTVLVDSNAQPVISLYHCKGSGGSEPGDRVGDLYEICGQAIKSVRWRTKKRLLSKVQDRFDRGSKFLAFGSHDDFVRLVEPSTLFEFPLKIWIVQPGVSRTGLSSKLSSLLTSTSRGLVAAGCEKLGVICAL